MTKLRHANPPHWGLDPGAVVQVPDTTRPFKYVSSEEKRRLSEERRTEEKARVERIHLKQDYDRLKEPVGEIKRKQKRGEPLSFWDQVRLRRWREVRAALGL